MGRRIRTTLPIAPDQLDPSIPDSVHVRSKERQIKKRQRENFNQHHQAGDLVPLEQGETVWIPDTSSEGKVGRVINPRSYEIHTPSCVYHRNRRHILPLPETVGNGTPSLPNVENEAPSLPSIENESSPTVSPNLRTWSGRVPKPPDILM